MKKLTIALCVWILMTAVLCLPALGEEVNDPVITLDGQMIKVIFHDKEGAVHTFVMLDEMEHIVLAEMSTANEWNLAWQTEGTYKARVYYVDEFGLTQSKETPWTDVRFGTQADAPAEEEIELPPEAQPEQETEPDLTAEPEVEATEAPTAAPLSWDDFIGGAPVLPSSFSNPVEYFEPTPRPTSVPRPTDVPYTPPVHTGTAPAPVTVTSSPVPSQAPAPTAVASYAGTKPCFDHIGLRIRIADNEFHTSTKGRSGPGTDFPQVATLDVGEVYTVLDCRILDTGHVHWFLIEKNGLNCWVASGRCERY